MLIAKEMNGGIWLADVAEPVNRYTPGAIGPYYYIGPGAKPKVSWLTGTKYLVTFQYLSSSFVRAFDIATWPPTQVDPVTYNPVSVQLASTWVPFSQKHSPTQGRADVNEAVIRLIRQDPFLRYDVATGVYSVTIQRDPTLTPFQAIKYRLYERNIGSPTWNLLVDWSDELINVVVSNTVSLQKEFCGTWGSFAASGFQNLPYGSHPFEHMKGPVISVNSAIESRAISVSGQDVLSVSLTSNSPLSGGNTYQWYTDMPKYYFTLQSEQVGFPAVGSPSTLSYSSFVGTEKFKSEGMNPPGSISDSITIPSHLLFSNSAMGF